MKVNEREVKDMVIEGLNDHQSQTAKNAVVKTQEPQVANASQKEEAAHFGVSETQLQMALERTEGLLKKKGVYLFDNNDFIDVYAMSYAFHTLLSGLQKATRNVEKLKIELQEAQDELFSYTEFIRLHLTPEQLEKYAKWKERQTQGRKRKTIDWVKYEHLANAGLQQKQIAQLLGVSPNTLRKLEKEAGKPPRRGRMGQT